MNDLISRTRPTQDALRAEFALDPSAFRIVPSVRRIRRAPGRRTLALVAAAILALVLAVPVLLPSWKGTPASAAALNATAAIAADRPAQFWEDGQFVHTRSLSVQDDNDAALQTGMLPVHNRIVRDDWLAPDGWLWSRRVGADGNVEWHVFGPTSGWTRPGYAATMPTDPHLLDLFLRARASGSASQDEAVFVAIGDMLKAEAAPPTLRATAIRVLGLNPKVTVTPGQDSSGRTALVATYVDEAVRPGLRESLYLDPATGDLLGDGMMMTEGKYESLVQIREVVGALPADVIANLGTAKVERHVGDAVGASRGKEPSPTPYVAPDDPSPHPSETYTRVPTAR